MASTLLKPRLWPKAIASRVGRLQLKRVHGPVLAWVIACWVMTVAVLVLLLWPGAITLVDAQPVAAADGLVGFAAPTWYRFVVVVAGLVITGALVVAHRSPRRGEHLPVSTFRCCTT